MGGKEREKKKEVENTFFNSGAPKLIRILEYYDYFFSRCRKRNSWKIQKSVIVSLNP